MMTVVRKTGVESLGSPQYQGGVDRVGHLVLVTVVSQG